MCVVPSEGCDGCCFEVAAARQATLSESHCGLESRPARQVCLEIKHREKQRFSFYHYSCSVQVHVWVSRTEEFIMVHLFVFSISQQLIMIYSVIMSVKDAHIH